MIKEKIVVLIVASTGYQSIEYLEPKKMLQAAGIKVITASDKPGGAVSADKSTTNVDLTVAQIKVADYDGIFFVGGPGAMQYLDNAASYKIINEAKKLGKWYGAICISPRILAKAHALEGVQATGWNEDNALEPLLKGHGAIYLKQPVVVDKKVITADGPAAADAWAKAIINQLT